MKREDALMQWIAHIFLGLFALACILPFVLLVSSSISDESYILQNGYKFFPKELSFEAYAYLWRMSDSIFRAYGITIFITVVGTFFSLVFTMLLAYPLSRRDMPLRNVLAFVVFFTLLFNGGLVPTYLVYTGIFHIKNTIWSLIIPGLFMNGFNVLLMRTFFQNTIDPALLEAARIDGAGEWRVVFSVVLPLSTPILATVGLFQAIRYWNDWMNGLIYLTNTRLYSIQVLLNKTLQDIQVLRTMSVYGAETAYAELPGESIRMAIAVVGILPMLAAFPFFQKYLKKGIALGGIKG